MLPTDSKSRSIRQLIQALQATRDSARVQLHLLSRDGRDRLSALEGKLLTLERKRDAYVGSGRAGSADDRQSSGATAERRGDAAGRSATRPTSIGARLALGQDVSITLHVAGKGKLKPCSLKK
jgi:hypothetical protein